MSSIVKHRAVSENGSEIDVLEVTSTIDAGNGKVLPGLSGWRLPNGKALNKSGQVLTTLDRPAVKYTLI